MNIRFKDKNLRPDEFSYETLVVCPKCGGKATVISTQVPQFAELRCSSCHYVTDKPLDSDEKSYSATTDYWFDCEFWLQDSFKNEFFFAHNYKHLEYIKQYIQAGLRERNDRAFFTLVEKLPQFIKTAKNRDRLLKMIEKLEKK